MLVNVKPSTSYSFVFKHSKLAEEFNFLIEQKSNYSSFKLKNSKLNEAKNNITMNKKQSKNLYKKKYSEDRQKSSIFEPIFTNVKLQFDKNVNVKQSIERNSSQTKKGSFNPNTDNNMSLLNLFSENSRIACLTSPSIKNSLKSKQNKRQQFKITQEVNIYIKQSAKRKFNDQFSMVRESVSIEQSKNSNLSHRCKHCNYHY